MQNDDFQYYLDNLDSFYARYPNKYVAIKNRRVLGVYNDMDEAVLKTAQMEPLGTFLIQHCVADIEEITVRIAGLVHV
jgi:hypothetical protein